MIFSENLFPLFGIML